MPLPAMAVAESCWSGAFFLEHPTTDGSCFGSQRSTLRAQEIFEKVHIATIATILSSRTVGSEASSFQSTELLQIFKTFCHGKFQPHTK